jgi:uncharacterized membrane protein YfcA
VAEGLLVALTPETYLVATLLFGVSAVFAALGLGGGMLYVPILHWLGRRLKTGAIPLGLLLNGLNALLAFLRFWREGLVDFRGGAPAALAALVCAPLLGARGLWGTAARRGGQARAGPDRGRRMIDACRMKPRATNTIGATR